ncbi:MAG: hypothetical protein H7A39_02535 [Chlamydiales bacterium]|nr:hypothetical protein [Chlamydiales bacterium]
MVTFATHSLRSSQDIPEQKVASLSALAQRALAVLSFSTWSCDDPMRLIRSTFDPLAVPYFTDPIALQCLRENRGHDPWKVAFFRFEWEQLKKTIEQPASQVLEIDISGASSIEELRLLIGKQDYSVTYCYTLDQPLSDSDIFQWRLVIEFFVKWNLDPFIYSDYLKEALVWASLWADVVYELGACKRYRQRPITDFYMQRMIGRSPEEILELRNRPEPDNDEESSEETLEPNGENCSYGWVFHRHLSPLAYAIVNMSCDTHIYKLLYKYGERPWGHELFEFIEICYIQPVQMKGVDIESVTTLLCETGCVEALCKGYLESRTHRWSWSNLCRCSVRMLESILSHFPSIYHHHLEDPQDPQHSILCCAARDGFLEHLECAAKYYQTHGLWTLAARQRAAGMTDDPAKKALLNGEQWSSTSTRL